MPNMQAATIYTLTCPLTHRIFYVGVTRQKLQHRACGGYQRLPSAKIIYGSGLTPIIEALDTCAINDRYEVEAYWIEQLICWGFSLDNSYKKPMQRGGYTNSEYEAGKLISKKLLQVGARAKQKEIRKASQALGISEWRLREFLSGEKLGLKTGRKILSYFSNQQTAA